MRFHQPPHPSDSKLQKSWTDDTDHALLIVLSYLHHDGKLLPDDLAARLRTWAEQGLRCLDRLPLGLGRTVGRVSDPNRKSTTIDMCPSLHEHYLTAVSAGRTGQGLPR
jgi:ADP-ribosylglycohydrolase